MYNRKKNCVAVSLPKDEQEFWVRPFLASAQKGCKMREEVLKADETPGDRLGGQHGTLTAPMGAQQVRSW